MQLHFCREPDRFWALHGPDGADCELLLRERWAHEATARIRDTRHQRLLLSLTPIDNTDTLVIKAWLSMSQDDQQIDSAMTSLLPFQRQVCQQLLA